MENFVYENPTRILFGRGMESQVGEEVKKYGNRVLLHYGKHSIKKSGLYNTVLESLHESGIHITELSGVKPNPLLSTVYEGIEICRAENIDLVLAVGGGSVIDSAKAIAFGVPYKGDVWDFFSGKVSVKETLPVGVILTFPGTGSESSNSCVITKEEGLLKRPVNIDIIRPKFAILNPELSCTLSRYQSACGGVDAMTHIMERYFTNTLHVDCTDRQCEAGLKTIINYLPVVLENSKDYKARAQIMWTSKIAHDNSMGVGRVGDYASHRIAHEISALYGLEHGATLSIIFPAWMKYNYRHNTERFLQFAVRVWDVDLPFENQEKQILEGIFRMENFFRRVGLPVRFSELSMDISVGSFETMAEKCTEKGPSGNMVPLEKDDIVKIYKLALDL